MPTRVQKWGNSLAVRIPRAFAAEAGLVVDSLVEVRLIDGQLVLVPVTSQPYRLADLLAEISDENLHQEVDTGPRAGNEAW